MQSPSVALGSRLLRPGITAGAVLIVVAAVAAAQRPRSVVSLTMEVLKNTVDGSELRGCLRRAEVEAGKSHAAWIAFGMVKPDDVRKWQPLATRTECGSGTFDGAGHAVVDPFGVPYLVVDLSAVPGPVDGAPGLETSFQIRKLSSFEGNRPVYTRTTQKRSLTLSKDTDVVVALLFADAGEREAFAANELLLRIEAHNGGRTPSAFGSIFVSADLPGLDIYLDGGLVGRTADHPVELGNIVVGSRAVTVRDFSGRRADATAVVKAGQRTDVTMKLLKAPAPNASGLASVGRNPEGFDEFLRVGDAAFMLRVPAGEFVMGSANDKGELYERPQRRVFLSDFLIDKTEVTWRQYRTFAKATGAAVPSAPIWDAADDYPVVNVRWDEANAYCEWAGGRLPTEAEWEKTARGTDGREFPWGNEWDIDRCNAEDGGPHRPTPVASFRNCVSPYGARDMVGSAREWCADWYVNGYPADATPRNPQGPPSGSGRVVRGGGWMNNYSYQRTAARFGYDPATRNEHIGFRCVHDSPK